MGNQDTQMDVESLQKSDSQRGRCFNTFLVVSIVFLSVAVIAVAAGGVLCMMELKSKLDSHLLPEHGAQQPTSDTSDTSAYKMQNFAYLRALENQLKTGNMALDALKHGSGTSVGSKYTFDETQISLKPEKEGTYFIYIDLSLTCTNLCPAGVLSVHVLSQNDEKLTCDVELPERSTPSETPVKKKCWTVTRIDAEKLHTIMTVPETGLKNWILEVNTSGVGMFLVD